MDKRAADLLFVFQLKKLPLLVVFALHLEPLVSDRLWIFKSAFVRKHCEYDLLPIDGAHAEHRAHADIRPALEFSRKHFTDPPHLFRDRHQFRPLSPSLSRIGHFDIDSIFERLLQSRRLRSSTGIGLVVPSAREQAVIAAKKALTEARNKGSDTVQEEETLADAYDNWQSD